MSHLSRFAPLAAIVTLAAAAGPVAAQEVYFTGGFPGVGGGVAFTVTDNIGVRGQFTTLGTRTGTGVREGVDFDAKLKSDQIGIYGDWFPARGVFRVTAGLSSNNVTFDGTARPNSNGTITVNNTTVPFNGADSYSVKVEYSPVTPYVGVGWGHNPTAKGWGFVADVGVHVGKFKATSSASASLVAKLTAAGVNAQQEIDAQTKKVQDNVDKISLLPALSVGVSYRW